MQEVVGEEPHREADPSGSQELGERRDARSHREAVAWTYARSAQKPSTFETKI